MVRLFIAIKLPDRVKHAQARLKQPATHHEIARFLDQPHDHELPKVAVQEFSLFQSQLTSGCALHILLKTFPLTDGRA
jgi:2'-5' RNA ligase